MSELKTEVDAGAPVSLFHVLFCFVMSCHVVSCREYILYCRCYRRCRHQLVCGMRYTICGMHCTLCPVLCLSVLSIQRQLRQRRRHNSSTPSCICSLK